MLTLLVTLNLPPVPFVSLPLVTLVGFWVIAVFLLNFGRQLDEEYLHAVDCASFALQTAMTNDVNGDTKCPAFGRIIHMLCGLPSA